MGSGIRDKSGSKRKFFYVWAWNAFIIVGLIVLACGKEKVLQRGTPNKAVTLMLFGAPWCQECKSDFPAMEKEFQALSAAHKDFLSMRLYVVTGPQATDRPTQQIADDYKAGLKLSAQSLPDEWRCKNYRTYVGNGCAIPAAAVVDANGKVIRSFRPGATFIPRDIVTLAAQSTL